jgi:hypothetical protein
MHIGGSDLSEASYRKERQKVYELSSHTMAEYSYRAASGRDLMIMVGGEP